MINKDKQDVPTHFSNDMLHVIDDCEIYADGESILNDLVERYQSQPGFMFVCRVLSQTFNAANYCWWLFTNDVAVNYEYNGNCQTVHCWAAPAERQMIMGLVTECNPFAQWELR